MPADTGSRPGMAKKLEDMLRKGMASVGQAVEKAIGKAQEAKQSVVTSASHVGSNGKAGTLEASISIQKIKELLRVSVERLVPSVLPSLADRRALEIGDGVGRYAPSLKEHGAKLVVATEIGASGFATRIADPVARMYMIRAAIHRLPFTDNAFDFGVANLLTPYQGNFLQALKELARILAPGGSMVITDFHPFGAYAKRGAVRVRPADSAFRGIGDYYKAARLSGLRVTDIRECFIDETVRATFQTPEEKEAYRSLRDSPLILCLVVKKGLTEAHA